MTRPDDTARRWRERRIAQQRRDVELETFPTTGGSKSKNASPMYGQPRRGQPPPRPPVDGAEVVLPVAWYHPLQIKSAGGIVTGWNDVSGWERHMTASTDQTYDLEVATFADGRSSVKVPAAAGTSTLVNNLFTGVFDHVAFPYGYTVFLVCSSPALSADDASYVGGIADVSADGLFRFYHNDHPQQGQQLVGYGTLVGDDYTARGKVAFAFWEPWDGSDISIEVNGEPWVDESGPILPSLDEPYGQQWVGFTTEFAIEPEGAGSEVAELIIIPAALSKEGRGRWWEYLRAEYPSVVPSA